MGKQMTFASMKAKIVRVKIEQGREGLFYGTSPDLRGLLIAERTRADVEAAIPTAIEEMYAACDTPVAVTMVDGKDDDYQPWVAVPVAKAGKSLPANTSN